MDTEQIETDLRTRLVELEARLEKIKQDATQGHSSDSAEQAQERENDEVLDQLGNETRLSIRRIQSALLRIAEGSYGVCESCGEEIQPGRLAIMPETTLCVKCAD
ncbi:dimethylmenaquinone methyltransferase [Hahella sp. CCB-MM4]|nr:dimethylmenaquinone methyltransferase [Hahella sp. CCB-MM4]